MSWRFDIDAVSLRRGEATVLDRLAFAVEPGAFLGVVGPNGAGKTSLLRLLAGLEAPSEGSVRIDGAELFALPAMARARRIAYLPQSRPLYAAIDVEALVSLGRFAYGSTTRLDPAGREAVERAMSATAIAGLRARGAHTLSGGECARAHLARALAAEAPVLIADEPVAALDPAHQIGIMRLLRAKADAGGLVVAALHEIALARRFCTRILCLKQGRLSAFAAPDVALADAARLFDLDPADGTLVWGAS